MSALVIYGPKASGKTRNAQAFLDHYGKKNIVEEWDGLTSLGEDDIALLTSDEPWINPSRVRPYNFIRIDDAFDMRVTARANQHNPT